MLAADAGELLGTRSERAIGQHRVAELIGPFKVVVVLALSSASSADESRQQLLKQSTSGAAGRDRMRIASGQCVQTASCAY